MSDVPETPQEVFLREIIERVTDRMVGVCDPTRALALVGAVGVLKEELDIVRHENAPITEGDDLDDGHGRTGTAGRPASTWRALGRRTGR